MMPGIQERIRRREDVLARARRYAEEARRRLGPCAVYLIGSFARGDFHDGSDIDLVVVSEGLPEDFHDRLRLLSSFREPGMQPIGYTPEEFARIRKRNHPTAWACETEGIRLADGP